MQDAIFGLFKSPPRNQNIFMMVWLLSFEAYSYSIIYMLSVMHRVCLVGSVLDFDMGDVSSQVDLMVSVH